MGLSRSQEARVIDIKPTYPVVYYYPGKSGTMQHFGHVAIALDKDTYITYGSKSKNETMSVEDGVNEEKATYGKAIMIPLPPPETSTPRHILVANWKEKFISKGYKLLTKNCSHSVSTCLNWLGYGHQLEITDNTRPSTIAKRACDIHLDALKKQDAEIEAEVKLYESYIFNTNPKVSIEKLIDNQILRLQL